jgi:hypothetical protein
MIAINENVFVLELRHIIGMLIDDNEEPIPLE